MVSGSAAVKEGDGQSPTVLRYLDPSCLAKEHLVQIPHLWETRNEKLLLNLFLVQLTGLGRITKYKHRLSSGEGAPA